MNNLFLVGVIIIIIIFIYKVKEGYRGGGRGGRGGYGIHPRGTGRIWGGPRRGYYYGGGYGGYGGWWPRWDVYYDPVVYYPPYVPLYNVNVDNMTRDTLWDKVKRLFVL